MTEDKGDAGWPSILLALVALLSLLYAGWALLGSGVKLMAMAPLDGLRLLGELLAAPALLLALAAAFRPRPAPRVRDPLITAAANAEELEARTTGLVARLEAVSNKVADDIAQIETLSGRLEERATLATRQAAEAMQAVEGLSAGAAAFDERLQGALSATQALERLLQALADQAEAAHATARDLGEEARRIGEAGEASANTLRAAIANLAAEAGEALRLGEKANEDLAGTVAAQTAALSAATGEARNALSAIGAEAARALGRHLDGLVAQARELESRITLQATATGELATAAEKSFQLLDKRMEHSAATTGATMEQLKGRLEAIHGLIDSLAEPIRAARGAVIDMDQAVLGLNGTVDSLRASLEGAMVAGAGDARRLTEELGESLADLAGRLGEAQAGADRLAEPVTRSAGELESVISRFEAQREAMSMAGQALVVELEQARQLIAEVEQTTESTSLAAATRLVDALSRVRDVSTQATGTMRAMLEGLIEEARQSLGEAASGAVSAGFVERIASEATRAEAKAREAAERSAASLARLAEAVRMVDQRTDERLGALASIADRDLASAATLLSERLAAESVTLAAAMGKPMGEADWAQWRKGERGLFGRRLVALLDKGEAATLKSLLKADPDLAASASRLVTGMDALLDRLEAGGQGGVAALVRGSEWGRLAAALSEAMED